MPKPLLERYTYTVGKVRAALDRNMLVGVVETRDGFLIIPSRARFLWLPFHGFEDGSPASFRTLGCDQRASVRSRRT